jgi:hypothetical protein
MIVKPFRLWAYHAEWIQIGANFAILPDVADPYATRRLRRLDRKAQRRKRRHDKRKPRYC